MAVTVEDFLINITTNMTGADAKDLKSIGDGINTVYTGLGKLIGLSAGIYGVTTLIKDFVADALQLTRVSEATNTSIESLSAWVRAVNAAGEDGSQSLRNIQKLSEQILDAHMTGDSTGLLGWLNNVGIATQNADGSLKDMTGILTQMADKIKGYSNDPAMLLRIGEKLGLDEGTIRFMTRGGEEVDKLTSYFRALAPMTKESAEAATNARINFRMLTEVFAAGSDRLLGKFMPAIEKATDILLRFVMWLTENESRFNGVLITLAVGFGVLAIAIGGATAAAFPLIAAMTATSATILGAIGAIIAIGLAIDWLLEDYYKWKTTGESTLGEIWAAFDNLVGGITGAIETIKKILVDVWNDPKKAWDDAIAYLRKRWEGMSLYQIGEDIIRSLWKGMSGAWETYVVPLLLAFIKKLSDWTGIDLLAEGMRIITSLKNGLSQVWNTVVNWLLGINKQIKEWFGIDLVTYGANAIKTFLDGLRQAWNDVVAWLNKLGIIDFFTAPNFFDRGLETIMSFKRGLEQAWRGVEDWFRNLDVAKLISEIVARMARATTQAFSSPEAGVLSNIGAFFGIGNEKPMDPKQSGVYASLIDEGWSDRDAYAMASGDLSPAVRNSLVQKYDTINMSQGGNVNIGEITIDARGNNAEEIVDKFNNAVDISANKGNMVDNVGT